MTSCLGHSKKRQAEIPTAFRHRLPLISSIPRITTPAFASAEVNHVPKTASRGEFFSTLLKFDHGTESQELAIQPPPLPTINGVVGSGSFIPQEPRSG